MLEILEALYRIDLTPEQWVLEVAAALSPIVDRDHLGVIGAFFKCPDPCSFTLQSHVAFKLSDALHIGFGAGVARLPPSYVAERYFGRTHSLGADLREWSQIYEGAVQTLSGRNRELVLAQGVDLLMLNATELDGLGCAFYSYRRSRSPLSGQNLVDVTRVSQHLTAAHRLRRQWWAQPPSPANADAVLDANGRVHHARGDAKARPVRDALARGARGMERARSRGRRRDGARNADGWPSLIGRWTLLDHVESDGLRYVLAIENVGARPCLEILSPREREIVRLSMRGHHGKAIAYDMGIAYSTVRVLKARVVAKLGVRGWREAIEKCEVSGLRSEWEH
jgi:DNA-binding CsgD family transcriptional regulator